MFQHLSRYLTKEVLAEQQKSYDALLQTYHTLLKQLGERLLMIDDKLLDINVSVKYQASYGLERHTEVMARLGMILTSLEKVLSKEPSPRKLAKKEKVQK